MVAVATKKFSCEASDSNMTCLINRPDNLSHIICINAYASDCCQSRPNQARQVLDADAAFAPAGGAAQIRVLCLLRLGHSTAAAKKGQQQ